MQSHIRSRWAAIGAAVAVTLGAGGIGLVSATSSDGAATLVSIEPCRLADTRPPPGNVGNKSSPLGESETLTLDTHGDNGQCTGIPTTATGLALNVTAIGATKVTFLTIWGTGDRPNASHLNPAPGQPPTPNAVTTGLTSAGEVNVFNRFGNVNVIVDVLGYYTTSTLQELSQRVASLEATQAAGADPAVLARIDALETNTATNTSGIGALNAKQPFAVTNRNGSFSAVTSAAKVMVAVTVTAQVAGQVTVNSTTRASENNGGDRVQCSITTGTTVELEHRQEWQSAGTPGALSQLAGTRTFDIKGPNPRLGTDGSATYNLVCQHIGVSPDAVVSDSVLTAIFTPAP